MFVTVHCFSLLLFGYPSTWGQFDTNCIIFRNVVYVYISVKFSFGNMGCCLKYQQLFDLATGFADDL